MLDQLESGRDNISTDVYWVAYIQGAFQESVTQDNDPDAEGAGLGRTQTLEKPSSNLRQGSMVYIEAIEDVEREERRRGRCLDIDLLQKVTVHEVGHQFGLRNDTGAIMNEPCIPKSDLRFLPAHIAAMRARSHP